MQTPKPARRGTYSRVLLKLSGEAFCKPGGFGIDADEVDTIAAEVKQAAATGAKVSVVVGGGKRSVRISFSHSGGASHSGQRQPAMSAKPDNELAPARPPTNPRS